MKQPQKICITTPVERKWFTIQGAMEYLGMSRDFIDFMRLEPGINTYRVGRTVFLKKEEIDRYIEKQKSAV